MRCCPPHTVGLERQFAKEFPPSCPFAAPQLQGRLLSCHRPGAPMAAKGWRQSPSSTERGLHPSPFPREGINMPHTEAQAPHFPSCVPELSRAWHGHTHHGNAGDSSCHPMNGELGPAAFSQIQKCRSLGPAHWAGLMFPRLIIAQDPFDLDCHSLDGETANTLGGCHSPAHHPC